MTRLLLAAAALAFVGCAAPEPPRYFSISADFSEAERETIRAAVDAWCESDAGSCPEEIGWSDWGRFELVDHIESHEVCARTPGCVVGGKNTHDGRVIIARDRLVADDMTMLWTIAAHEWGHFCIDGHPVSGGLMAAIHEADEGALTVDDEAVSAWKGGCGL